MVKCSFYVIFQPPCLSQTGGALTEGQSLEQIRTILLLQRTSEKKPTQTRICIIQKSMECQQTIWSALWQCCTHKQQSLQTSWRVVSEVICMPPYRLECLPSSCLININIAVLTDKVSLISLWLQFFESFFFSALTASLGLWQEIKKEKLPVKSSSSQLHPRTKNTMLRYRTKSVPVFTPT